MCTMAQFLDHAIACVALLSIQILECFYELKALKDCFKNYMLCYFCAKETDNGHNLDVNSCIFHVTLKSTSVELPKHVSAF